MDLPTACPLELQIRRIESSSQNHSALLARGLDQRNGLPVLRPSAEAKVITLDDVKRIEEER